jgi:DNA-binding transcriptional LysR family regulator
LFIRTRHGVKLTSDGEALLRYCHTVLDLEGETLAKIKGAGVESAVRICITGPSSMMASRVIPQCLTVMKQFPQLLIKFDINDTDQIIQSLQTGHSQFAIIEPQYVLKEMKRKKLHPEKYVLVCGNQWKDRELNDILANEKIIDFDESDSLTINYLTHFKLLQHAQTERHFLNRTELLANMLVEGYGYGVLTEEFSQPYLEKHQLITLNAGKIYENTLVLAWYDRPEPPAYFSSLIKAIS